MPGHMADLIPKVAAIQLRHEIKQHIQLSKGILEGVSVYFEDK